MGTDHPHDAALEAFGRAQSSTRDPSLSAHVQSCPKCQQRISLLTETEIEDTAASARPDAPLPKGTQLGRFVVLDRLGQGGMGVVYSAFDPVLERKVALKLLRLDSVPEEQRAAALGRLAREARSAARLSHPHVVAVYDAGDAGAQGTFVAMELVEGTTLGQWQTAEQRPWRTTVKTWLAAAEGLFAAHQAGIVHRDFKPANVLIGNDGRVRVADFGLARALAGGAPAEDDSEKLVSAITSSAFGSSSASDVLTRPGVVMGTPAYMSPEQFKGHETDARSDQFAFCIALFEALYGERPFAGTTPRAVLTEMSAGRIVPGTRRGVPRSVRRVLLKGLSYQRDARYPDMGALIAELRRTLRRRWLLGVYVAGGAAISAVAVVSLQGVQCQRAGGSIHSVWNAERRAAIEKRWPGEALGPTGLAQRFAERWRGSAVDACVAAQLRRVEPQEVWQQRTACLERQRRQLDTTLSVLLTSPQATADSATEALAGLPTAHSCSAAQLALTGNRPVPAVEVAERVAEKGDLLTALQTRRFFDLPGARSELERALPELEGLRFIPLQAEALKLLGELQSDLQAVPEAEASLEGAVRAAERSSDDVVRFGAEVALARVAGWRDTRFDKAYGHLERAAAVLDRIGRPLALDAELQNVEGTLRFKQAKYEAARQGFERALALERQLHGGHHPRIARIHGNLAMAHKQLGDFVRAEKEARQGVADLNETAGPTHRWTRVAHNALASILLRTGRPGEAIEHYTQSVIDLKLGAPGADDLSTQIRIALAMAHAGRAEEARKVLDGAEALVPTMRDEITRVDALFVRAELLTLEGDLARASETMAERAVISERIYGRGPALVEVLIRTARARLNQGDLPSAAGELSRARELSQSFPTSEVVTTELKAFEAELLSRQGKCEQARPVLLATLDEQLQREPDPTRVAFTRAALMACAANPEEAAQQRTALLAALEAKEPLPTVAAPEAKLLRAALK